MPTRSDVTRLIPLIYDAAEDPALWAEVLNRIASAISAVCTVFTIEDLNHSRSSMAVTHGMDPAFVRLYNERYEAMNLHVQRARPLLTPGRVLTSHQLASDQEVLATEYYHEFLRPQGYWFHIVGGCIAREDSLLSLLSFMRGRSAGRFTENETKLLESLIPHLRRSVGLHHTLSLYQTVVACLDAFPTAALVFDQRSRLQYANRAGLEITQANDGIGINRNGCLSSTNPMLCQLVSAACTSLACGGASTGTSISIPRPSGKHAYTVTVSPIRQRQPFSAERQPGAIVFVSKPDTHRPPMPEILIRLYGLTPTEAKIASLLADGKDLACICQELGIRRTTARTHLGRIREKLGVKRQAEVVAVILKAVGFLPAHVELK